MSRERVLDFIAVSCLMVFFAFWAMDGIGEQGLYTDVAIWGDKALGVYRKVPFEGPNFLNITGRSFPLMVYLHGAVEIYWVLPWVYLFGNKAISLNLPPVLWSIFSIPLCYMSALLFFRSRQIAFGTAFLLASSPAFVAASRLGLYTGTLLILFVLWASVCFLMWKKTLALPWILGGCLALGLGVGSRIFFWWLVLALLVCTRVFRRSLNFGKVVSVKQFILCCSMVGMGLVPLLVSNVKGEFWSLRFLWEHLFVSSTGVENLSYWFNLKWRLRHLLDILGGGAYNLWIPNYWVVGLWILGVILHLFFMWFYRDRPHPMRTRAGFLLLLIVLVLVQSPITPTGLDPHHLLLLLPFLFNLAASWMG